ncbi:MAG: hypothetical protein ACE5IR_21020 [bacterium]
MFLSDGVLAEQTLCVSDLGETPSVSELGFADRIVMCRSVQAYLNTTGVSYFQSNTIANETCALRNVKT